MSELYMKAALAGVFFGIWPLFMNRSGLGGNTSSAAFCLVALVVVLPFALRSTGVTLPDANWLMVVFAGAFGAAGLLVFGGIIAKATPQNIGAIFVFMTVVQITVTAIYQTLMNGGTSPSKIGGYITAGIAAYLLLR